MSRKVYSEEFKRAAIEQVIVQRGGFIQYSEDAAVWYRHSGKSPKPRRHVSICHN